MPPGEEPSTRAGARPDRDGERPAEHTRRDEVPRARGEVPRARGGDVTRRGVVEPAEHVRFARYLRELVEVPEAREAGLVAAVLRDPDGQLARSAIVRHFGRRAPGLLSQAAFPEWAARMERAVGGDGFLTNRLREWTLIRSVVLGEPWTAEDLVTAGEWCQRTAVDLDTPTPPEALAVLAAWGRTQRIRTDAGRRLSRSGWR